MNITQKISAAALATVLTIGGTTAVFAADSTGGEAVGAAKHDRIAKLCEHQDEIVPKLTQAQTTINERIVTLTDRKAQAAANGHDRVVKRIDRRLERLGRLLERVTNRLDQAPAWIAEHCS